VYEWKRAQHALHLDGKNLDELSQIFDEIDVDKSGSIDLKELDQALKKTHQKFGRIQLDAMMNSVDANHDGKISREEFLNVCHAEHNQSTHIPQLNLSTNSSHPPKLTDDLKDVFDKHDDSNRVPRGVPQAVHSPPKAEDFKDILKNLDKKDRS
jgi:predicted MarR family transcription regulator